eukprot:6174085-Amphidinium_carterae.1
MRQSNKVWEAWLHKGGLDSCDFSTASASLILRRGRCNKVSGEAWDRMPMESAASQSSQNHERSTTTNGPWTSLKVV